MDVNEKGAQGIEGLEGNDEGLVLGSMDSSKYVESLLICDIDRNVSAGGVKLADYNESLGYQEFHVDHPLFKTVTCVGLESSAFDVNAEEEGNVINLMPKRGFENTERERGLLGVTGDVNVSKGMKGKVDFQVSDIVWGKVRSHPWWPGQICDSLAASELAKKCWKKGSHLIAYFGDRTFAWNEAPKIRPFLEHFSKMEKQTDKKAFQHAVDCALDEVSRRVEFELVCSCIPKKVYSIIYSKLKTQIISNTGIRKEASRRVGGDSTFHAASFEPAKLIKFAKKLAQFPYRKANRLELVTTRAQLSAFYSWECYYQFPLPEESDTYAKLVQESESVDNSLHKFMDVSDSKVQMCLSPMTENESEEQIGNELISQPSRKKRKVLDGVAHEDAFPVIDKLVWKSENKDVSSHKYKHVSGDNRIPIEEAQRLVRVRECKMFVHSSD